VTIVNRGTGYVNGETITVTSGSSNATFTIVVVDQFNNWTFDQNGKTQLPGALAATVAQNAYDDETIPLNVNALINRIVPTAGAGGDKYSLADGDEGQIMYIVAGNGGETSNEYTEVFIEHARYSNGAGVITQATNVGGWLPFRDVNKGSTVLTLVFIEGHWNLPHNNFD
jgi:hypothetical protein